jgi:hypothetical protein
VNGCHCVCLTLSVTIKSLYNTKKYMNKLGLFLQTIIAAAETQRFLKLRSEKDK